MPARPAERAPRRPSDAEAPVRHVAAGIAAAAAALGGGELVAAVLSTSASPILSVGSLVIDLTPAFLKSAVIAAFGTGDKPFLIVVLLVVVLALGALTGLAQARRPPVGVVLVLAAGLIAASAAATRSGASSLDVTPSLVAAAIGVWILVRLTRTAEVPDAAGRRRLVVGAVVWAGLGILGGAAARGLSTGVRSMQQAIDRIHLPVARTLVPPVPSRSRLAVPGLTPLVTSNADFYRIDIALNPPAIDPAGWAVEIAGEVEHPFRLTYAQLTALPTAESYTTLMCVSNEVGGTLNGTARWQGVPLRDLLARARPKRGADMVLSSGADGFSASTPLSVLQEQDRGAILAIGMNGEPLPQLHGFPVRMVVPGLYGYVSATKWLTRLEVTRFDVAAAYWTTRGYSAQAPIKLSSRIDVPGGGVRAGVVAVAGVAWAQHTGIDRVQLQIDGGPWRDCALADELSKDVWRQWQYRWIAQRGAHTLRVRATDRAGVVQTARITGEIPDGSTGLHTVQVAVS